MRTILKAYKAFHGLISFKYCAIACTYYVSSDDLHTTFLVNQTWTRKNVVKRASSELLQLAFITSHVKICSTENQRTRK